MSYLNPPGPSSSSRASSSPEQPAAPDTPPKQAWRSSSSPYMRASPSAASPAPAATWTRPTPLPFVNGRGNLQLASTPRTFTPSPTLSHAKFSPVHTPPEPQRPQQHEGQQAYVRASPSPTPGATGAAREQRSSPGDPGHVALSFPSAFGVRQRVALKRTSVAPPPHAAAAVQRRTPTPTTTSIPEGPPRGLGISEDGQDIVDSRAGSPTQVLPSPPLVVPPPPEPPSSQPHLSPQTSPQLSGTWSWEQQSQARTLEGQDLRSLAARKSTASSASSTSALTRVLSSGDWSSPDGDAGGGGPFAILRPPSTSVLDRPRPRTPDSRPSPASSPAARSIPIRPNTSYTSPSPSMSTGTASVLDRPRPKSPEPAFFAHSPSPPPISSSTFTSTNRTATPTLPPSNHPPQDRSTSSLSQHSTTPTPSEPISVLNRPRPKTPEFGSSTFVSTSSFLPSSSSSSFSSSHRTPTTSASTTPTPSFDPSHRKGSSIPTSSSILDRPRPKTPDFTSSVHRSDWSPTSLAQSTSYSSLVSLSSGLERSTSELSLTLSFGSGESKPPPPMLELDLGGLGLGTEEESMFDLASILNPGSVKEKELVKEKEKRRPPALDPVSIEPRGEYETTIVSEREERQTEAAAKGITKVSAVPFLPSASPTLGQHPPSSASTASPRRRQSIASLLSLSTSNSNHQLDQSASTGRASSEYLPRSSTSHSTSQSTSHSTSHSTSKLSISSTASQSSSSSHTPAPTSPHLPFSTPVSIPHAAPSPPQLGVTFDKSLPPTPTPASPASVTSFAASYSAAVPDDSPTKGLSLSTGSGGGSSALRRGLSKLRPALSSSTSAPSKPTAAPAFQLVSATSSRGGTSTRSNAGASARRLVERFAAAASSSGSSSSHTAVGGGKVSTGPPESVDSVDSVDLRDLTLTSVAPEEEEEEGDGEKDDGPRTPREGGGGMGDERRGSFPTPPRRASLSGLLGEKALGMSLGAARKSADALTSLGRESPESDRGRGRGSFDLLPHKKVPIRRPSTDNLLTLATAKLSKLTQGPSKDKVKEKPPPPAREASPSPLPSSPTSPVSTASVDHAPPEKAAVVVATRVHNPDASAPRSRPPVGPRLVRSDSLRGQAEPRPVTPLRNETPSSPPPPPAPVRSPPPPPPPPVVAPVVQLPVLGPSPAWRKKVKIPDSGFGSDSSLSSAWLDVEDALAAYAAAVEDDRPERGNMVTNTLLPFLRREEDSPGPRPDEVLAARQRQVLFAWLATLTQELREMQPSHRGACLEAVAAIVESRFMSASVLENDPAGQARYRTAIVNILSFATEKLNDKAVYANTLVFSGRVFALAFFRIDGVAHKLLRALPPVKRHGLQRILEEAGVDSQRLPPVNLTAFPSHLWPLCLRDFKAYVNLLLPPVNRPQPPSDNYLVSDGDVAVEMSGNWLIRWTASDSDLPFAFYRAYHRQLAAHLIPPERLDAIEGQPPLSPSEVVTAPGFLFLAASLLDKCDGLIRVNLRSVTSIGPNNGANFNTNDSANLNFGQKPKVLELANRRLVTTMLDIVGGPPPSPTTDEADIAPDADIRRHAFSAILGVWIRSCVKRVSMWNTRGVFLLMDLVEGLIYTLSYPTPSSRGSSDEMIVPRPHESCIAMFDPPFIFSFVKIILATGDNTIAIMRTIAFIYAHFEIFTLRPADRDELCENIILDEVLFPRLYLHWNPGVRGYFIRLLVWRLARLGVVAGEQPPPSERDPKVIAIFGLMNARLEAIRKRHDELEPADNWPDDDPFKPPKRSTICSTRGVKEAPFTVDELVLAVEDSDTDSSDSEPQELVRPVAPRQPENGTSTSRKTNGLHQVATVARVVSWLKGGLGKRNNKIQPIVPPARIDPFVVDQTEDTDDDDDDPNDSFSSWVDATSSSEGCRAPETSWGAPKSPKKAPSTITMTPERRGGARPESPAFFQFEFEGGAMPARPADPDPVASSSASTLSADTVFPGSPHLRGRDPHGAVSPRVSLRFSKRISILPPAALDMLKESGESVPQIPEQWRPKGYDKKLHAYAIRGLCDYEDAIDEWTDWMARLQEEEDSGKKHNRGFIDTVPRLSVSWPSAFEDMA